MESTNKSNEEFFQDFFEKYYGTLTTSELYHLIEGYFGNGISLQQLREIIDIYQAYNTDITSSMTKEIFFNEIGYLLSHYFEEIKRGNSFNKRFLNDFLGMGKGWYKTHSRKEGRLSTYRRIYFNLKEKIKNKSLFLECKNIIDKVKTSEIKKSSQVGFSRLIESIQDLYSRYIPLGKVGFTSGEFSTMLYGFLRSKYISTRKGKVSIITTGQRDSGHPKLPTYLLMEHKLLNIKLKSTEIPIQEKLIKFKSEAIALIRWHYLQESYVHLSALREASILFRIVHFNHDPNRIEFSNELNSITPSHYDYLKGKFNFGVETIDRLEKLMYKSPPSNEKDFINNLILEYKQNYMGEKLLHLRIGSLMHIYAEDISFIHFKENYVTFENEKFSNYPVSLHRIDTWIKINKKLKIIMNYEILDDIQLDLESMNEISIDYTSVAENNKHILQKLNKNYQRDDRPLLIVIYGKYSKERIHLINNEIRSIQKGRNCRLITLNQFLVLFNFNSYYKKLIKYASDLTSEALTTEKAFRELQEFNINNPNPLNG